MATVNLSDYKPLHINNAEEFSIGIVFSEWNDFVTYNLRDAALEILEKEGVKSENIRLFSVPGAFELNYASMQLCKERKFDAVIAIGCVIRGETPHFDFVCDAVAQGIKDCNILTDTPTIFCVLTDDTKEQSIARSGGDLGNKGVEAAVTALSMINFKRNLSDKKGNIGFGKLT
ncbi:6,7-dimethyl-8-ribityllumazine synthase [Chryseobacterium wangxinyae]|uniref:6,7-dimethyl-8-ribityllumazine synthase n=1 Tax=Chryseobacterium sp. CY353 TaxID=2997334 RepID=UPI002270F4C4|nr:6,7-dimethyl-8-ribityllumazine synthase [Chryseobacterium sp. CY353]MCY0969132.1 6,7-dimethyl-8-ribityllumazine synthase [Chryseobacterium sp. CY353]